MQILIGFSNDLAFLTTLRKKYQDFVETKKTILFIEPYGAVLSLLKHGLLREYNIIILTANMDFRKVPMALLEKVKLAIRVDTASEVAVLGVMQFINKVMRIQAVIPGFEYFVPLAVKVSQYMGLPSLTSQQALNVRRKDWMRIKLKEAKLACPRFVLIQSITELEAALVEVGLPAVCKPVDAAGSVHVKKVTTGAEAKRAALRILEGKDVLWGHPLSRSVLIEEYIAGDEISVEGVIQSGQVSFFSVTEKLVADQSEFVEIGHIVNAPMDDQLKKTVENYVAQVITVLGANHCPFHAELRITAAGEPVLMEFAARLAGDKIGDLISLSRNIAYFDYVYTAYFNEPIALPVMDNAYAGIRFFYRPAIDRYSFVQGVEDAKQQSIEEIIFYYKPHEHIPDFPKPLRRLGHVMIKSSNYSELVKMLKNIDAKIIFYTEE